MRLSLYLCFVILALVSCVKSPESSADSAKDLPAAKQLSADPGHVEIWADPLLISAMEDIGSYVLKEYKINTSLKSLDRGDMLGLPDDPPEELPDVLLFAGEDIAERLREAKLIETDTLRTFAGDRLVVAQKRDNIYRVSSLFDMYKLFIDHFALGEDSSTAGFYGNQALITSGSKKRLEAKDLLVMYPDTAAILDALVDGSAELGMITASTAARTPDVEICRIVDETYHEDIRYIAAVASGKRGSKSAMKFVQLIAEDEQCQQLLMGYGLTDRETALDETP